MLDEAGYTMGDDGLRTMPDGSPIGTLRLFARSDSMGDISLNTMDFFKEWLADLGIESEVTAMQSNKLTDVILEGDFDAFQWGWYVEPDPTSMLSYMTCAQRRQLVGLLVLQRGVRRALRRAAGRARPGQAGRDGQADAADALRGLAVPRDGVQHRRRGVPQRPVRVPGAAAEPGRRLAVPVRHRTTTRTCRLADEAGDCGGDASATKATSAAADDSLSTGMLVAIGVGVLVRAADGWRDGDAATRRPRRIASDDRSGRRSGGCSG